MKNILTVKQMRDAEDDVISGGTPSRELMYRAGKGIAAYVAQKLDGKQKAAVVCGHGNNGGDGFVAAWLLDTQGADVTVYFVGDEKKLTQDSRFFFDKCKHLIKPLPSDLCQYGVILDAIYGTGFHGKLEGCALEAAQKINGSGSFVISADIPSGICGSSCAGNADAVRADVTVCIEAVKTACACGASAEYAGKLETVEIGVNTHSAHHIMMPDDLEALMPSSKITYHKNCYGSVGIVGGSKGMEGAAMLAAVAASKSGVGKVSIISELPYYIGRPHHIMLRDKLDMLDGIDVIAYGMGAGRTKNCADTVKRILSSDIHAVLDADAVYTLADDAAELVRDRRDKGIYTVFTPHVGEAAKLLGISAEDIHSDPISCARAVSEKFGCITVLKSWYTVVCYGDNIRVLNMPERALAKAGSGDCLAGIVSAMLARCVKTDGDPFDGVCAAVLIHSDAGRRAGETFGKASATATDIANSIFLDR